MSTFLSIPVTGWIALSIWLIVLLIPWTYSLYFIKKINDSGVERWGAKKPGKKTAVRSKEVS
ncbi:MAG TPA: hypothetical protein VEY51_13480 [Chondromyces sp.]|nr:hypothetical protein [Chondromyces sp.]